MRAAVIDLGTNTFHLVIAELDGYPSNNKLIYKTNIPVRLGESRINDNMIIPEAFERGLDTLKIFKAEIVRHGADAVHAVATSAVRNALNGGDFVRAAAVETGIDVEVISGNQEAEYIFHGVKASGAIKDTALIMDIGGGSTEFIICNEQELLWKQSYDIGAARMMQAYFKSDPLCITDHELIIEKLDETLGELRTACATYQPVCLIGSAGAFESFAMILDPQLRLEETSYTSIDLQDYRKLASLLLASNHEQRRHINGLIPLRVDMIVMAALLTNYVLDLFKPAELFLSTYDLKMGVLDQMASKAR